MPWYEWDACSRGDWRLYTFLCRDSRFTRRWRSLRQEHGKPNKLGYELAPIEPLRLHNQLLQRAGVPWKRSDERLGSPLLSKQSIRRL